MSKVIRPILSHSSQELIDILREKGVVQQGELKTFLAMAITNLEQDYKKEGELFDFTSKPPSSKRKWRPCVFSTTHSKADWLSSVLNVSTSTIYHESIIRHGTGK